MFTIKQAAHRVGVSESVLRAWERRYDVVAPRRTDSGYRLYDEQAIAVLSTMRRLVDEGWAPAAAARHLAEQPSTTPAAALTDAFLEAAAGVDVPRIETVLDQAFAQGSFETVTEQWLMPTLTALGDAWADGWLDVAGEHAASHVVMRRLSQAFAAAGAVRGPRAVVALPPGSHHEIGALAFATIARRRGLAVVYLGADLPVGSWVRGVNAFPTRAAVVVVPTSDVRPAAERTVEAVHLARPELTVAVGGGHAAGLGSTDRPVVELPASMTAAVDALEALPG